MKLKELRLKENKTQSEMAKLLNMSQTGYNGYETGRSEPDIKTLKKLSKLFHTSIDNIVDNETPHLIDKSVLTQPQRDLFEEIQNLSDKNCERVKAFITGINIAEEEKRQIINFYKRNDDQ